jgi:hypothetical protein
MWQIAGNLADGRTPDFTARVDLSSPEGGVCMVPAARSEFDDSRFLQVRMSGRSGSNVLRDSYVRGRDLIAHYGETGAHRFSPDVYWRILNRQDAGAVGIELLVSVQTELLDVDASIAIGSDICCVAPLRLVDIGSCRFEAAELTVDQAVPDISPAIGLVLYRLPAGAGSYAEMVHPSDLLTAGWLMEQIPTGRSRSSFRLVHQHLEKGVLRRARVRGVFLPTADDEEAAVQCFRHFAESAVPLSA